MIVTLTIVRILDMRCWLQVGNRDDGMDTLIARNFELVCERCQWQVDHEMMEDGNAYRIELGTVGWERCWGAVTWTPSNRH
jgi:hypothetical protein